jgi:wobble nucleotide-excising tRNase
MSSLWRYHIPSPSWGGKSKRSSMIRRVQRITSFGVFNDFTWPGNLHEFKQFNLLFGWNYSGKTTLSRTLRCFELLKRHDDFNRADVHLHCDGDKVHILSTTKGPHYYRVFNVDFVRENIFF